ncbi:hypothetical protein Syun_017151 [Stephania yunnanensis]|uniref:Uncharacterized protein n=1 Tax=Stephania yunnanensis TaxID=152371 RepID=A0AAP0J6E5_9MAGN
MEVNDGDIKIDEDELGPFMVGSDKLDRFMDQHMEKAMIVIPIALLEGLSIIMGYVLSVQRLAQKRPTFIFETPCKFRTLLPRRTRNPEEDEFNGRILLESYVNRTVNWQSDRPNHLPRRLSSSIRDDEDVGEEGVDVDEMLLDELLPLSVSNFLDVLIRTSMAIGDSELMIKEHHGYIGEQKSTMQLLSSPGKYFGQSNLCGENYVWLLVISIMLTEALHGARGDGSGVCSCRDWNWEFTVAWTGARVKVSVKFIVGDPELTHNTWA